MKPNTCVICGNPCKKKTCGDDCRRLLQNQQHAARKRAKRAAASAHRDKLTCQFCGKKYLSTAGRNRKTCGATACQDALRRLYDVERYGRVKSEFDCPICGKHVSTYRRSQTTCGSESCYHKQYGCVNEAELREKRKAREMERALASNGMPCPWSTHQLDYLPPGVASWDDPIMDPMGCGTAKVMIDMEMKQERRAA